MKGAGVVRLGGEAELTGRVTGLGWEGGTVESDWKLTGRGRIVIQGTAVMTSGPGEWLRGSYKWESAGRLRVTGLEAQVEGKKLVGRATGKPEGPVTVEFGDAVKLRVAVDPFGVTVEPR